MITGNKDTDRLFLLELDDRDLLSACSSNKYLFSICDENLFRNKVYQNKEFVKIKDENSSNFLKNTRWDYSKMSFKKFYLQMVYHIGKLKEKYNFNYVSGISGDPKKYYDFLESNTERKGRGIISAARDGFLDLVKYFLDHQSDININDGEILQMPLRNGKVETVKYLLDNGVNRDFIYKYLPEAVRSGNLPVIKFLHEQGINIHYYDDFLLRNANKFRQFEIVDFIENH